MQPVELTSVPGQAFHNVQSTAKGQNYPYPPVISSINNNNSSIGGPGYGNSFATPSFNNVGTGSMNSSIPPAYETQRPATNSVNSFQPMFRPTEYSGTLSYGGSNRGTVYSNYQPEQAFRF